MSYEGNEKFGFRFGSLSEAQAHALREHCPSVEVRPRRDTPGRFVGSFSLSLTDNYDWLQPFVQEGNISDSEYGLFVSLVTRHDSEIVSLPPFVLDLHRRVGGGIDFSFTVVFDSE